MSLVNYFLLLNKKINNDQEESYNNIYLNDVEVYYKVQKENW